MGSELLEGWLKLVNFHMFGCGSSSSRSLVVFSATLRVCLITFRGLVVVSWDLEVACAPHRSLFSSFGCTPLDFNIEVCAPPGIWWCSMDLHARYLQGYCRKGACLQCMRLQEFDGGLCSSICKLMACALPGV